MFCHSLLNNRFLWERGMSTVKMEYQVFLCIFQNNSAMTNLGLKEMRKFLWENRENQGERNGHWIDILRYLFPPISLTCPDG